MFHVCQICGADISNELCGISIPHNDLCHNCKKPLQGLKDFGAEAPPAKAPEPEEGFIATTSETAFTRAPCAIVKAMLPVNRNLTQLLPGEQISLQLESVRAADSGRSKQTGKLSKLGDDKRIRQRVKPVRTKKRPKQGRESGVPRWIYAGVSLPLEVALKALRASIVRQDEYPNNGGGIAIAFSLADNAAYELKLSPFRSSKGIKKNSPPPPRYCRVYPCKLV